MIRTFEVKTNLRSQKNSVVCDDVDGLYKYFEDTVQKCISNHKGSLPMVLNFSVTFHKQISQFELSLGL